MIALILSKFRGATLDEIRHRLSSIAEDITTGQSYMGDPAGPRVDDATGYGLVGAEITCS